MSTDLFANLVVKSGGLFLGPNTPAAEEIYRSFSLRNPEYAQACALRQRGKYVPMPDEYLYACRPFPPSHPWGAGGLMVPRNVDLSPWHGLQLMDRSVFPPCGEERTLRVHLRDYQKDALAAWRDKQDGIIVAPCGAGKTTIGMGAIESLDTKALVLVHTKDLADQWMTRCEEQIGVSASLVGSGTNDDSSSVVIALFQSLATREFRELMQWGKQFGLVIIDEAHHVPADTFAAVMMAMPARYRLGLTATPNRPDGLTPILHWHLGPTCWEITNEHLISMGLIMAPRIEWLFTGWNIEQHLEWSALVTRMAEDPDRNQLILERVKELVQDGRQVLVLSGRVNHCLSLAESLQEDGIEAAPLVGKMTKKARAEVIEAARNGTMSVITATTIADEGLDIPNLEAVVLTTPTKSKGRIQQRIGRVMRICENKSQPIVVDLVDGSYPARQMAKNRSRLYRSLGCDLTDPNA